MSPHCQLLAFSGYEKSDSDMRGAQLLCVLGTVLTVYVISFRSAPEPSRARFGDQTRKKDPRNALFLPLRSQTPYVVPVINGECRLDLDFSSGAEYRLIVSSLSDSNQQFPVQLNSHAVKTGQLQKFQPLLPLPKVEKINVESSDSDAFPTSESVGKQKRLKKGKERRTFFLHVTDGNLDDPQQYARVEARLMKTGRFVRVYLDSQQSPSELHPQLVSEIVRVFDEQIVPTSRKWLGEFRDIDEDGTFAILLSPWLGRLQGGRVSLGGFVRGADFRSDGKTPFSNRCDMLYLNSNVTPGANLRALLAHEFAHAVNFSLRLPSRKLPSGCAGEEDWLNESLAHLAENLNDAGWSNLDHRVSRFLDSPESYPLVVADYYAAGLWRNHGCRGATYLFLRWCVDQFGPEILSRLMRDPVNGCQNLENATGLLFPELFRRWSVALATSNDHTDQGYHSIDLQGDLGNWSLAGPRFTDWDVNLPAPKLTIRGTAAAFFRLHSSSGTTTNSLRSIVIQSTPEANLQVTLIKLESQQPGMQAENFYCKASWESSANDSRTSLRVDVELPVAKPDSDFHKKSSSPKENPISYRIETITVEQNRETKRWSKRYTGEKLAQFSQPKSNSNTIFYRIPVINTKNHKAPNTLKVRLCDSFGRRITKRIEIPQPRQPVVASSR
jgi:hypothetical protein